MGSAVLNSALPFSANVKAVAEPPSGSSEQFGVTSLTLGGSGKQHSVRLRRFLRAGGFPQVTPTSTIVWWDYTFLHVEFLNTEPDPRYKGNPGLAKPNKYPGNGRFELSAYPDAVYVYYRPSWSDNKVYEFAVDSSGMRSDEGYEVEVKRLPGRWTAHFKIDWKLVGGRPIENAFGLNMIRSRGQSSEVLSPVALDQTLKLSPDLLMFTQFGDESASRTAQGILCTLPGGDRRWQLPTHLAAPSAQECEELWQQQSVLDTPTTSQNIDRRVHLAQRLYDILVLEGFSFHTDGSNWRVMPGEFYPHEARIAVNRALTAGDLKPACATLDIFLGQLDRAVRRWFADESPCNIRSDQWVAVTDLSQAEQDGDELRLNATVGKLQASLWISECNGAIRIRNANKGLFEPQQVSLPELMPGSAGLPHIAIEQQPWRLVIFDSEGFERWSLREGELFFRLSPLGDLLGIDIRSRLSGDEDIYGFGERFNALGQRKKVVTLWGVDCWSGNIHGQLNQAYKNIPLAHSTAGYSLFWNSTYRLRADVGSTNSHKYRLTVFGNILDLFIWPGRPEDTLRSYTELTGKPITPPQWVFEPWMGGGGRRWANGPLKNAVDEELHVVQKFRELDIPHSAIYAEGGNGDPKLYAGLRGSNLHVLAWMYESMKLDKIRELLPGLREAELPVLHHRDGSIAFRNDDKNAIIDYTHPSAAKLLKAFWQPRLDLGLSGSMVDFGDVVPDDAVFYNGKTGTEMHNFYARSYHRLYQETFQARRKEDYVLFARAACAGDQQSVCHFAGDHQANFFGMRAALRGGLNAAASGLSTWGADAGGYAGWPDPEVYIRWTEWATFCPLMRFHGTTPREPWEFGEQAVVIYKKYAWLRESLLPYILSCAAAAQQTGMPILRPMPLAFPHSRIAATCDDQYLFGPDLLIAPMVGPGDSRTVVLPSGVWTDFWTGRSFKGGGVIEAEMPLDHIGVFLRAGVCVPLDLPPSLVPGESMSSVRLRVIIATRPPASEHWKVDTTGAQFLIQCGNGRKQAVPLNGQTEWTVPLV